MITGPFLQRGNFKPTGTPRLRWDALPRGATACPLVLDNTVIDPLNAGSSANRPATSGGGPYAFVWTPYGAGIGFFYDWVRFPIPTSDTEAQAGYSLETLIYTGATATSGQFLAYTVTGGSPERALSLVGGSLTYFFYDGGSNTITSSLTLAAHTLYHIVVTHDTASTATLYVNGVSVGTASGGTRNGFPAELFIGEEGGADADGAIFQGIYARVGWSAQEVAWRYVEPYRHLVWPDEIITIPSLVVANSTFTQSCLASSSPLTALVRSNSLLRRSTTAPVTSLARAFAQALQAQAVTAPLVSSSKATSKALASSATSVASALRSISATKRVTTSLTASLSTTTGSTVSALASTAPAPSLLRSTSAIRRAATAPVALFARAFSLTLRVAAHVVARCIALVPSSARPGRTVFQRSDVRTVILPPDF